VTADDKVQSFSLLKQILHAKSLSNCLPTGGSIHAHYMAGDTRMWVTIAIGFVFFAALAPFIFIAVGLLLAMPPRSWLHEVVQHLRKDQPPSRWLRGCPHTGGIPG
jgi:hypothetical protein